MSIVRSYIEQYASRLRARIAQLEGAGKAAPEPKGSLRVVRVGKYQYFNVREYRDGRQVSRHVSRSETALLSALAQKRYDRAVLPKLRKNLHAAEAFLSLHSGEEEAQIGERIDPAILSLCGMAARTISQRAQSWVSAEFAEQPRYGGEPQVETAFGMRVRSKSEAFIAEALARHRLIFKYEKPLRLKNGRTVFPDFTILDDLTMKEYYWEHLGRMDDPEYVRAVCGKLARYVRNGLLPGDALILSFEDQDHPLSPADAERYAKMLQRKIAGDQRG